MCKWFLKIDVWTSEFLEKRKEGYINV
jgi:hypothetical protein